MAVKDPPFTAVQIYLSRRGWRPLLLVMVPLVLAVIGLAALVLGVVVAVRYTAHETPTYAADADHFEHGSIGAETANGIPYKIWQALPALYPDQFGHRADYSGFGFIYGRDAGGRPQDLPIGMARSRVNGIDMVWFNCATCHTGSWRETEGAPPHIVPGMPSNRLDLKRFIQMILDAGVDERMSPDALIPVIEKTSGRMDVLDRLMWRLVVIPRVREGLIMRRARLGPLLAEQPAWGPGRVDTFNPYKLIQLGISASSLSPAERIGVADFPSVFNQAPREGMNLHWDGNNNSLAERNLSAALGAGVTPQTVNHASIERVAGWLMSLPAPPSPNHPDPAAVARGRTIYMANCSACHGWSDPAGHYVFKGERLGQVEPDARLGADPARLNSYTQAFRDRQIGELFAGTPYHFTHFHKTDGYADMPLDGLWLRAPYLHNGSVPTLAALLQPPADRPPAFLRGSDVIDRVSGGFVWEPCSAATAKDERFCFDTRLPGNGSGGHLYGTALPPAQKQDLLAYLLTF